MVRGGENKTLTLGPLFIRQRPLFSRKKAKRKKTKRILKEKTKMDSISEESFEASRTEILLR